MPRHLINELIVKVATTPKDIAKIKKDIASTLEIDYETFRQFLADPEKPIRQAYILGMIYYFRKNGLAHLINEPEDLYEKPVEEGATA